MLLVRIMVGFSYNEMSGLFYKDCCCLEVVLKCYLPGIFRKALKSLIISFSSSSMSSSNLSTVSLMTYFSYTPLRNFQKGLSSHLFS